MRLFSVLLIVTVAMAGWSCSSDNATVTNVDQEQQVVDQSPLHLSLPHLAKFTEGLRVSSNGAHAALYCAEYISSGQKPDVGRQVFFRDVGDKALPFFPVADANFHMDGNLDVSYYIDENRPSGDLNVATTSAAINRAMATWDGVKCSDLGMTQVASNNGITTGVIAAILGYPGSFDNPFTDITHCGWMDGGFFDNVAPDGSQFILAVTFTFIWVDGDGNPTDMNGDGKMDHAFSEIYYNDGFLWQDGDQFDVETIALHEAGHGLCQNHFGKASITKANGKLHFSPQAVMNAAYTGVQTTIGKTDNGGHCDMWSEWP